MRTEHRIEAIALKEIGVFKDLTIYFDPIENLNNQAEIHILTGENGFGKSTILYALASVFMGLSAKDSLISRRFLNSKSYIAYEFNQQKGLWSFQKLTVSNNFFDVNDRNYSNAEQFGIMCKTNSENWNYSSAIQKFKPNLKINTIYFDFAVFGYAGTRTQNDYITLNAIEPITESPFLNSLDFTFNATNSKNILKWIANKLTSYAHKMLKKDENATKYLVELNYIKDFIKNTCDLTIDFEVNPDNIGEVLISIDEQKNLNFDVLPDGLKSILSWVIDLANRLDRIPWRNPNEDIFSQPIILFLDEIDIHLHPKWQRKILPAVQKLLTNAQIFVSTHSPFVVGSVEHARVYKLPNPNQCEIKELRGEITHLGHSVKVILEDTFDIYQRFDSVTTDLLNRFYNLKDKILKKEYEFNSNILDDMKACLIELIKIAEHSEELEKTIASEIHQLNYLGDIDLNDLIQSK